MTVKAMKCGEGCDTGVDPTATGVNSVVRSLTLIPSNVHCLRNLAVELFYGNHPAAQHVKLQADRQDDAVENPRAAFGVPPRPALL